MTDIVDAEQSIEILTDPLALEGIRAEWDELAVLCRQPMSSPAWLFAWLKHVAPARSEIRVIVVREHESIVAIAPFFVQEGSRRVDYQMMGSAYPRTSPLTLPGREREVAGSIAQALSQAKPRPDLIALECLSRDSPWPDALREHWPGAMKAGLHTYFVQGSPVIELAGRSYQDWLASLSTKLRHELGRRRRRFEDGGGRCRFASSQTVERDIASFMRLHRERWDGRGASSIVALGERMSAMLHEIALTQIEDGRLRLLVLEIGDRAIGVELMASAGGETMMINHGWDESFGGISPVMLFASYGLEDAFARGETRLDFAPGTQPYKQRFADSDRPVAWSVLIVPSRRLPLTYMRTAPMMASRRARDIAKRRLPEPMVDRLRTARTATQRKR